MPHVDAGMYDDKTATPEQREKHSALMALFPVAGPTTRIRTAPGVENMRTHAHLVKAIEYATVAARETNREYKVWFDRDDVAWTYSPESTSSEVLRIIVKPNGDCFHRVGQSDV